LRQEYNSALETLRDKDRRAVEEVTRYQAPLDPADVVPLPEVLASEILPVTVIAAGGIEEHVLLPSPAQQVAALAAGAQAPPWPDQRALLRTLAARAALEQFDPWEAQGAP
jgi:hypothetical protein